MKPAAQYEVVVDYGHGPESTVVTARSRAGARYAVYLDFAEVFPGYGFWSFLPLVKSVRKTDQRTPYDYVLERYCVRVEVGQRVAACKKAGVVAEPKHSRDSYVRVLFDDERHPSPVHPGEIEVLS